MAEGALSIKLRCASWQQLATIYKRDLSRGTMFLRAAQPPVVGTAVRIDLALPSSTVIALEGVVGSHVQDPLRGNGVEITLAPIPASSVWLIESALASETRRLATPVRGVPVVGHQTGSVPTIAGLGSPTGVTGSIPTIQTGPAGAPAPGVSGLAVVAATPGLHENAEVAAAEQDLIKALVSEAESLKKLNPFLVLGVGYEAGDAEVRAAFGELTKRYHPDRFTRYESVELRQVAAEIFILIRDAYRKLGDATVRSVALQALGKSAPAPRAVPSPLRTPASGPTRMPTPTPSPRMTQRVPALPAVPPVPPANPAAPPPIPPVPAPISPSGSAAPAAAARPAATAPVPSVIRPPGDSRPADSRAPGRRDPTPLPTRAAPASTPPPAAARPNPAAHAQTQPAPVLGETAELAALEDMIDQGRLDEALSGYRMMAKRHGHNHDRNVRAGIELCEGLLALGARDRLEAAQRFETALEIDPSNERAARELAEMRRQATNERKGLLSRLMGKKEPPS
jgi:hypothetical protein